MDRLAHKYWSDVFKQSHDAKTEQTNHRNRTLKEDEMPQQGKSDIPVRIRRTVAHTNLQALESRELQQQFTSNQEQAQNISPRCVMAKRIYHEGESKPLEQDYPQQSKTYRKNHQVPGNQQKDGCPPPTPIQNVPQRQAEKPSQDQFKQHPQQQYRETANQNSIKQLSHGNPEMNKPPFDKQTHKNTPKIMEQCQQAEHQNPPEKILSENQFKQQPPQGYQETGYQKSIKKYRHRIPHNMQQPDNVYNVTPHMKLHHLKTEFQDLPVRDQYIDRTEATSHDQCKQQPSQEYRKSHDQLKQQQPQGNQESSYQNFTKKTSLENPQNIQQPHDDHKITPHMKLHHLKTEYQDLPMKDQYIDRTEATPHDQLKQQQHLVNQDIAYQKYQKKTLLKNFLNMQQNPYKGHLQVPPHDQLKQQPHQQNLDNSNQNSTMKPSLQNPQSMQQSTQQRHENYPQEPQMYRKDNQNPANQKYLLTKQKERYPSPTPTPSQNVPQNQPGQQYPKASHQHFRKHQSNDNHQQRQQLPQQPLLICDNHKNTAMLQHDIGDFVCVLPKEYQKYPKKDPYKDPLQAPPHDKSKQQPSLEYRGESFCHSPKQSQKQPFSNAPLEQAQLNLSESNSMAKVLPVPRPEPNRRRVPQNSFMGYKFKVEKSPEGCKKDNPKKVSKGKQSRNENQLFEISAKTGDELRSMVREEMELQMLLMELSEITKKGEILDATPSTSDKSPTSKSLESNETTSTSSAASSEESQADHDITVHSIVNGKVITPMIRKIQDMYIRNLRYELDLVEYLQQVPGHVTEVCRDAGCKDQSKLEK